MPMESSAFCPGHITAFFEPVDDPDAYKKGSRGAGLCISLGVKTQVKARLGSHQQIRIFVNREELPAETTRLALARLIGGAAFEVVVQSEQELPIAQGFGMSAAGTLAAVLAANDAMDLGVSQSRCVAIAHAAEVEARTGLGDVVPASLGGMDLRLVPGAPPNAVVKSIPVEADLLLAVVGPPMPTKAVLSDPARMKAVLEVGKRCVDEFAKAPTLDDLFRLGKAFSIETGLADEKVKQAIEAAGPYGKCSMSMLGNAVFAVGQVEELDTVFKGLGAQRYRCKVDGKGARLLTRGA